MNVNSPEEINKELDVYLSGKSWASAVPSGQRFPDGFRYDNIILVFLQIPL